jgi:chemotaxis protein MotB
MPLVKKKKKKESEGSPYWMLTYGDMTTLLLTFFVMMFTTAEIDGSELRMILAVFQGLGIMRGGNTLQSGKLAEYGNTLMSLPSMEQGRALDKARKLALALFQPEIHSRRVRIKEDERGLIISLSAEIFFAPGDAEINPEATRELFSKLTELLESEELAGRKFRIEGHTDSLPVDPAGPYETNWELSTARALSVLHRLLDYMPEDEDRFQVAGYADTVPVATNATEVGRAENRRVDIIILTEGHL